MTQDLWLFLAYTAAICVCAWRFTAPFSYRRGLDDGTRLERQRQSARFTEAKMQSYLEGRREGERLKQHQD